MLVFWGSSIFNCTTEQTFNSKGGSTKITSANVSNISDIKTDQKRVIPWLPIANQFYAYVHFAKPEILKGHILWWVAAAVDECIGMTHNICYEYIDFMYSDITQDDI